MRQGLFRGFEEKTMSEWDKGWPKSPKLKHFCAQKKAMYRNERGRYYYGDVDFRVRARTYAEARKIIESQYDGEYKLWWKKPYTLSSREVNGYVRIDEKVFPITSAVQRLIDTGRPPKILKGHGEEVDGLVNELLSCVGLYRYVKNDNAGGMLGRYQVNGAGSEILHARWRLTYAVMKAKGLWAERYRPKQ
jgi:hypothetical protein